MLPLQNKIETTKKIEPGAELSPEQQAAARTLRPVDAGALSAKGRLTELDLLALTTGDSTYAQAPPGASYYRAFVLFWFVCF
jgi:hypothetical protein